MNKEYMNKAFLLEKLGEKTGRDEKDCILINDILEDHFVVGRGSKMAIMADFQDKLGIDEEAADELYNTCCEIIMTAIFKRK